MWTPETRKKSPPGSVPCEKGPTITAPNAAPTRPAPSPQIFTSGRRRRGTQRTRRRVNCAYVRGVGDRGGEVLRAGSVKSMGRLWNGV